MRLKELSHSLDLEVRGLGDPEVTGLTEDSRQVRQGDIFAAVEGAVLNGRSYIESARAKGAAAVLIAEPDLPEIGVRLIAPKDNFRQLMSQAARLVYGRPDEKLELIGLTGTSGKTTISYLLEAMLSQAGYRVGVIGTVDFRWPGIAVNAPNTTPEGPLLYKTLSQMADSGCRAGVLEVSSHALELGRIGDLKFRAALFTNLSRDHLDYHGDMESYYQAKRKLFTKHLIPAARSCAVCLDDPYGAKLFAEMGEAAVGYGFSPEAWVRGSDLKLGRFGLTMTVTIGPKGNQRPKENQIGDQEKNLNSKVSKGSASSEMKIVSPLLGDFNALNLLGAIALGEVLALPAQSTQKALERSVGAPGRLERVGSNDDFLALVDYAHKPAALKAALESLRTLKPRRLIAVFGCGGDRDRGKRPLMGAEAGSVADIAIVTSDNPRTEDPQAIINETIEGLTSIGLSKAENPRSVKEREFISEVDRRQAIKIAVNLMEPGDILLVAGKGHETYQILGREKKPFDDRLETLKALEERAIA
jgi:UDP-N-acetylmuramyl-tripeptide synthetase